MVKATITTQRTVLRGQITPKDELLVTKANVGIPIGPGPRGYTGSLGYAGSFGYTGSRGDFYRTTSTTSETIGIGTKSFITDTIASYSDAQNLLISFDLTNYMEGLVVSYNRSTGELVVDITSIVGSGTYNNWEINISGAPGPQGYTGSKGDQGDTGFTGSKGDIGFTGSKGDQGDIGFTGSQGDQGVTGFTGSKGDTRVVKVIKARLGILVLKVILVIRASLVPKVTQDLLVPKVTKVMLAIRASLVLKVIRVSRDSLDRKVM